MSEIMRCVFEKREPVRNVTALALMQYACEEFPRSRVDVVGMDNFMDKPSMGDDDILWSVEEREDDAAGIRPYQIAGPQTVYGARLSVRI